MVVTCGLFYFGVMGAFENVLDLNIQVPTWMWWTGFLITISLAQFLAFKSLYNEMQGRYVTFPNFTFKQLMERAIGKKEDIYSQDNYSNEKFQAMYDFAKELRQQAILGHIQVWGRRDAEFLQDSQPRVNIPMDFWTTGELDTLQNVSDFIGKAEAKHRNSSERYSDLAFARHQVEVLWPGPRWRMKYPFKIYRKFWYHDHPNEKGAPERTL